MEIHFHINLNRPRWMQHWSRPRKLLLISALTLLLLPGLIVLADHLPFNDVPTGGALHDAVGAVFGAGITNGTSETTYSPDNPVTRGQMAFFLGRGLPRVAFNQSGAATTLGTFLEDRGVVTINTGGVAGGTGFVKLDAAILAYTGDTSGCPCEVRFQLWRDGSAVTSFDSFTTVYNNQGGVDGNTSGKLIWALSVPTASTQTFRLKIQKNSGSATVLASGQLTALYVPFGSMGSNTLAAEPGDNQEATDQPAPEAQVGTKSKKL